MSRAVAAVVLLLLSGCLGAQTPPHAAAIASTSSSVLPPPVAPKVPVPRAYDRSDWFTLDAASGPGGRVTAFAWRVPNGSFVDESSGFSDLIFEVAPQPANQSISQWGFLAFSVRKAGTTLESGFADASYHVVSRLGPLATPSDETPSLHPFYEWVLVQYPPEFKVESPGEGDELFLVVAAESAAEAAFRVSFRVLAELPAFGDQPADDYDAFVKARGNQTAFPLRSRAVGEGFQVSAYDDFALDAAFGGDARSASARVRDELPVDLRPMSGTRRVTLSSSFAASTGWDLAEGFFLGTEAVGTWSVKGQFHNQKLDAHSILVDDWEVPESTLVPSLLFGIPIYLAIGEGAGPSTSDFRLDVAQAGEFYDAVFLHLDLGTTLASLTGHKAATGAVALTGLLGNVPPASGHHSLGLTVGLGGGRTALLPIESAERR